MTRDDLGVAEWAPIWAGLDDEIMRRRANPRKGIGAARRVSCDEEWASALPDCERAVGVERLDSWGSRCVWGVRGAASEVRQRRRGELARARLSVVLHPRGSERARGRTPLTQHSRRCASIGHSSASPALRSSHPQHHIHIRLPLALTTSRHPASSRLPLTTLRQPLASASLHLRRCTACAVSLLARARTSPTHSAVAHTPRRPSPAASAASAASAGPRPRLSTCLG